jgi:hypothetical protein
VTEQDEELRQLLWAHRDKGWLFETTLAVLRKEYEEKPFGQVEQNYGNMLSAVKRMFGDMWLAFKQSSFDETFIRMRPIILALRNAMRSSRVTTDIRGPSSVAACSRRYWRSAALGLLTNQISCEAKQRQQSNASHNQ